MRDESLINRIVITHAPSHNTREATSGLPIGPDAPAGIKLLEMKVSTIKRPIKPIGTSNDRKLIFRSRRESKPTPARIDPANANRTIQRAGARKRSKQGK